MNLVLAFLLVVIVDGEVVSDDRMLFRSVYRCNEFSVAIEEGRISPNNLKRFRLQKNISSYCIPRMVSANTILYE